MALTNAFPAGMREVLCASSLIPLKKKDGGVRPIAVGETIRRVVGKCLLQTEEVKMESASLQPRQCGVGVRNAAEMVGMGLQRLVQSRAADGANDYAILQVDMRNAFNSISRDAVLRGCLKKVPSAYNWLRFCYGGTSPLYCQGRLFCASDVGVHQGDACGPLGFALGLDEGLDQCEPRDLLWESWYLDDGHIIGTLQEVLARLEDLHKILGSLGFSLNLAKCKLWGPGIQRADQVEPRFPDDALVNLGLHATDAVGVPPEVLRTPAPDMMDTMQRLQAQLGPNMDPLAGWILGTTPLATATKTHATQKWWAEQVYDAQDHHLNAMGSVRDRVRRVSQKGPLATGWLRTLPSKARHIPDAEFRLLLTWWLGLPILRTGVTLPGCPLCGEAIDPFGDHFVCCERNGCTQRHNAVRDAFFAMCVRAGMAVEKEARCVGQRRPADILLLLWSRGQHVAIDFVCTHPAGLAQHPLVVENAAKHCNRAEAQKVKKDGPPCEAAGWGFSPFAINTWGGLGSSAKAVLFEVTKRATADLQGWPKTRALDQIRQDLSVTLMREIARQLSVKGRVEELHYPE